MCVPYVKKNTNITLSMCATISYVIQAFLYQTIRMIHIIQSRLIRIHFLCGGVYRCIHTLHTRSRSGLCVNKKKNLNICCFESKTAHFSIWKEMVINLVLVKTSVFDILYIPYSYIIVTYTFYLYYIHENCWTMAMNYI